MNKPALLIIVIVVLLFLIPISILSYNSIIQKKQTNLGYDLLEKYGWSNTQLADSSKILISKEQIKNYPNLSHGLLASQKINFDYGKYISLKVNILVFKLNEKYDGKQLYAHILATGNKIVGAYITTEFKNDNNNYYFSLTDINLEQPIH